MLVLFGVDGVVLKDVLCALGGLGGVLGGAVGMLGVLQLVFGRW